MSKEDPLLMKPRTTILAAILGLSVLVSAPVTAEVDTISCGELHPEWIADWVDRDTEIKFPTGGNMAQHSSVVGEWLADHPESRHEHGANCVYRAFKEAYGLKN